MLFKAPKPSSPVLPLLTHRGLLKSLVQNERILPLLLQVANWYLLLFYFFSLIKFYKIIHAHGTKLER